MEGFMTMETREGSYDKFMEDSVPAACEDGLDKDTNRYEWGSMGHFC